MYFGEKMNIVLITQDEPFFLAENLRYLLDKIPVHSSVRACVVLSPSPFGRKKSFLSKAMETRKIFGNGFFFYYGIKYILSKFDKRKNVVKVLNDFDIPIIYLEKSINNKVSLGLIQQYKPDLLISILGNEIFKKSLRELPTKGCLNLHTALLPKYRGLMPTFWVLKNNEKQTGVSVFFVDEDIDSGKIVAQRVVEIPNGISQEQLIQITKKIGMQAIIESIEKIEKGNLNTIENNDDEATYYSMPTREDVKDFMKKGKRFY